MSCRGLCVSSAGVIHVIAEDKRNKGCDAWQIHFQRHFFFIQQLNLFRPGVCNLDTHWAISNPSVLILGFFFHAFSFLSCVIVSCVTLQFLWWALVIVLSSASNLVSSSHELSFVLLLLVLPFVVFASPYLLCLCFGSRIKKTLDI